MIMYEYDTAIFISQLGWSIFFSTLLPMAYFTNQKYPKVTHNVHNHNLHTPMVILCYQSVLAWSQLECVCQTKINFFTLPIQFHKSSFKDIQWSFNPKSTSSDMPGFFVFVFVFVLCVFVLFCFVCLFVCLFFRLFRKNYVKGSDTPQKRKYENKKSLKKKNHGKNETKIGEIYHSDEM